MNEPDRNCRIYLDPSIRWTDKVTLCANGDIVEDCSGKIIGYITPDNTDHYPCDNCIELECENHGVVCPHYKKEGDTND